MPSHFFLNSEGWFTLPCLIVVPSGLIAGAVGEFCLKPQRGPVLEPNWVVESDSKTSKIGNVN